MKKPIVDKDLTGMLRHCDNEDLEPLVSIILAAPSQTLTLKEGYKAHPGDHKSYVDEIIYEITSFGGNTLANLVRGQGIPYADMVRDVAQHLSIKPSMSDTVPVLEEKIIIRILQLAYDKLSDEDKLALQDLLEMGSDGNEVFDGVPEEEIGKRIATAGTSLLGDRIQHAIRIAARSARFRQTITSTIKAGLAKLGSIGLGGPVSWTVAAGQTIYEMFGPNYTVAIGLVAQIGLLRQKYAQMERDTASYEAEENLV